MKQLKLSGSNLVALADDDACFSTSSWSRDLTKPTDSR